MNCNLVKNVREIERKDGQKFNVIDFYLVFSNGTREKILPNEFTDDKEVKHSNRKTLSALADNDMPF